MSGSFTDGVAIAITEGNMLRARAAAAEADYRAREATKQAEMNAQEASKYRDWYTHEKGVSMGLQALLVALRNSYVLSLPQPQRDAAGAKMVSDARKWMERNLKPEEVSLVTAAWVGHAANWNEELGLIPWPDVPAPRKPEMTESVTGWFWKKTLYHFGGQTFRKREEAEALLGQALNGWRAECAVWARRQKKPDPSIEI